MARFAEQVAVVTGGGSGLGLGIAERLASEGARVSVWDRDERGLALARERLGAGTHCVALDITDPRAVARAADDTAATLGRIDILVASAGITGPNAPSWDYALADWDRVIDTNLNGVYYTCRAVVPHMRRADYGRIVALASVAGKEGNPNAAAYSASKAGVIGFVKALGKELAPTAIRVNCVAPAAVRTPLFSQMTAEQIAYMLSRIPLGRFGEIEEVASMVCFLASRECSFSTGAVFDVSGGRATY